MDVYDAAAQYEKDSQPVIILAGKEYGSGSSRDWAAKGPWILVSSSLFNTCGLNTTIKFIHKNTKNYHVFLNGGMRNLEESARGSA